MATIHKSITINGPVDKVFAYVDDPMTSPEWLPSMTEVSDVSGSGVGQHYRWKYKMVGIPLQGETTVTECVPNEREVVESKGGIDSTWTFTFDPIEGGTKMEVVIDYTVPIPVLGKLAERLVLRRNERELDLAMDNIKDKLEG